MRRSLGRRLALRQGSADPVRPSSEELDHSFISQSLKRIAQGLFWRTTMGVALGDYLIELVTDRAVAMHHAFGTLRCSPTPDGSGPPPIALGWRGRDDPQAVHRGRDRRARPEPCAICRAYWNPAIWKNGRSSFGPSSRGSRFDRTKPDWTSWSTNSHA